MTEIKEAVRQKYSQAALRAGSCCGTPALEGTSPITSNLYSDQETGELPEAAVLASLGLWQSDSASRTEGRGNRP
jgi:arsenite methyltransferase